MADDSARTRRWAARSDPRTHVRTAVVWEALDAILAQRMAATGRDVLDVVDLGGGTGGFAVPVARLGHRVTVVDPSPDALAALQRRAAEAEVGELVRAEQGDAATLGDVVPVAGADLVLCHGVLEYVDDPATAAGAALAALRPGGVASFLVAQRLGAVLARALAGRFGQAQRLLDDPEGRFGDKDPLPRRFDQASLRELLRPHEVEVVLVHGVRLFTDLLPGSLVDADPETVEALLALERSTSNHPAHPQLADLAAALHFAVRTSGAAPAATPTVGTDAGGTDAVSTDAGRTETG